MSKSTTRDLEQFNQLYQITLAKRQSKFLSRFSGDLKMELLFLIWLHEDNEEWGIADYINCISASPQSNSTIHQFIKQLIKDGVVVAVSTSKKSRKHLILSDQLRTEVHAYCSALGEMVSDDDMDLAA